MTEIKHPAKPAADQGPAMEKLGVLLDALLLPRNILPILKALGPERYRLYWQNSWVDRELQQEISGLGLEMALPDEPEPGNAAATVQSHQYYLIDYRFTQPQQADNLPEREYGRALVKSLRALGKRFICTTYSMEDSPRPEELAPGDFFLSSCDERTLAVTGPGRLICDPAGHPEVGLTAAGAEVATVGLYHVPDLVRNLAGVDKRTLQAELAAELGAVFNPDLPVVLYTVSLGNEGRAVKRGLTALAGRANVVLKVHAILQDDSNPDPMLRFHSPGPVQGPNIHILPHVTERQRLDWPTRFAADVVLIDPWSGGLFTNMMVGLRSIIVHSNRMMLRNGSGRPANYARFMREPDRIWVRLAESLPPVNIEAADMLVDRINDREYWAGFDREAPRIVRGVFGRFWIGGEAAKRAATYIKRALDRGSLVPNRSEMPEALTLDGPACLRAYMRAGL